ncbi:MULTISPECIES: hypothetical protein [Micromonospora]|uniref:Uncharacterized protein n=1 Tax=Micromonospora solifontis TaxID=2487138 RepID=A0ABX9WN32_9ACTN|nr:MULTISPECIES: hypothetical protein [Micromonospora]NES14602.1 hypothetical protein [Micromonospora sp. PPF5-17B]NES35260.1 hypothetical protein [Micromonospora solifontis]RNM00987.1 hypothetical protein EFE23_03655 [Micromonospora solifontis]
MNAVIDLGNGDSLQMEPARRAFHLYPGAGGAQIEVTLRISKTHDLAPGIAYRVSARMYVEDNMRRQRMLCTLDAANLVTPLVRAGDVQLSGFVTDEQLRVVEQLRAGGDLWVNLKLSVSSVEWKADSEAADSDSAELMLTARGRAEQKARLSGEVVYRSNEEPRLTALPPAGTKVVFERPLQKQRTGDLRFDINAGEWAAQMAAVEAGTFVELLVPLAGGADYAGAVALLREARELLREGNVDASIGQARKALEQARKEYGTQKLYEAATKKSPRTRALPERWAIMVEDLYSTMSGAAHNDEVTKEFTYSQEDGAMLITATAGMLKRLAADRQTL